MVQRLAKDDFTVVILDINEEGGKQVAAGLQGTANKRSSSLLM